MSNETNEDTNDTNERDNAKDNTNDTNEEDNAKDEDDDDNDEIDKRGRKGHSFSTATSKFMAQGGRKRRNFSNTGSKRTNVGKFTTHKGHSLSYILNNDQESSLVSTSRHWTKELGESSKNSYNTVDFISLLQRPSEERETEIKAACSKLSKNIFDIYETSLKQKKCILKYIMNGTKDKQLKLTL
ncbi:hypothetical protein RhiirC2_716848 [Rhizophagus irregularis]|uniref:Uncharacterized protein n=1 Tax=Rhizophagus irregularis TaxID=588596 RepID=A0A2N1MPS1_9GLOM|nr:hypothetical protein RhiirC2_716848 [Rhizophagus irregularis]